MQSENPKHRNLKLKSETSTEKPISILANKIKEVENISVVAARKAGVKNSDIRSKRRKYNYKLSKKKKEIVLNREKYKKKKKKWYSISLRKEYKGTSKIKLDRHIKKLKEDRKDGKLSKSATEFKINTVQHIQDGQQSLMVSNRQQSLMVPDRWTRSGLIKNSLIQPLYIENEKIQNRQQLELVLDEKTPKRKFKKEQKETSVYKKNVTPSRTITSTLSNSSFRWRMLRDESAQKKSNLLYEWGGSTANLLYEKAGDYLKENRNLESDTVSTMVSTPKETIKSVKKAKTAAEYAKRSIEQMLKAAEVTRKIVIATAKAKLFLSALPLKYSQAQKIYPE